MRALLRSWRIWCLALAVMAAPQLSLVHALSHVQAAAAAASQPDDERQQAPHNKACDTCLLLAHLGQGLTAEHTWADFDAQAAAPVPMAVAQIARRAPAPFQARAPPSFL